MKRKKAAADKQDSLSSLEKKILQKPPEWAPGQSECLCCRVQWRGGLSFDPVSPVGPASTSGFLHSVPHQYQTHASCPKEKDMRIVHLHQLRAMWQKIILKGDMIRTDLMSSIMDLWRFSVSSVCQLAALLSLKSGTSDFSSASLLTSDISPLASNSYSSSPSSSSVGSRSSSPLTGRKRSVKYISEKYDIRAQNQYRAYDGEL